MTEEGEDERPEPPQSATRDYQVGYGKPPKGVRFEAGKSGNPKGRPKKKAHPDAVLLPRPVRAALRDELTRSLTLADGTELSTLEAVARATVKSALKGSAPAQRTILQFGRELEDGFHQERAENLKQAWEIRVKAQQQLDHAIAAGYPRTELLLHPTDLEVDEVTGELRLLGPTCLNRDEAIAALLKVRDEAQAVVLRSVDIDGEDEADILTEYGHWASQVTFDLANECLPPRLRKDLVGRSPPGTPLPFLAQGTDAAARLRKCFEPTGALQGVS